VIVDDSKSPKKMIFIEKQESKVSSQILSPSSSLSSSSSSSLSSFPAEETAQTSNEIQLAPKKVENFESKDDNVNSTDQISINGIRQIFNDSFSKIKNESGVLSMLQSGTDEAKHTQTVLLKKKRILHRYFDELSQTYLANHNFKDFAGILILKC
jgi:hypothetical protein